MTHLEHLAQILLEFEVTPTLSSEIDKALLRIFEVPSLQSKLNGISSDGGILELDFVSIPDSAVEPVKRLIGPTNIDVFKFDQGGQIHTAFRVDLSMFSDPDQSGSTPQSTEPSPVDAVVTNSQP